MKPTQRLHDLGQSLWLDNITRPLLSGGSLKRYIEELSVTGLTSNPTIFDHAISNSAVYDAPIRDKLRHGESIRYVENVEITMAETLGVEGRGAFYDQTGAIRDVVQNHLFQVLTNLTMELPVRMDSESIRDEKVKVLKAIAPITENNLVRGQFRGYKSEKGVAPDSKTETFAALRFEINSWRWQGVPIYIRAGKCLPVTCTELLVRLRRPPQLFGSAPSVPNHFRLRISPDVTIAFGMMAKSPCDEMLGEPIEMLARQDPQPGEMDAYERVLHDAMIGDPTLFAREDYIEEAWRIVDLVLKSNTPVYEYEPGTWGPAEVGQRIVPADGWHNPIVKTPPGGMEVRAA